MIRSTTHLLVLLLSLSTAVRGFTSSTSTAHRLLLSLSSKSTTTTNSHLYAENPKLVVVSPPGGVGEVAAVKAATQGAQVQWFVVSPPPSKDPTTTTTSSSSSQSSSDQVVLSQQALQQIADAGGKVELAGADAASLLLPQDDASSAMAAVATWCRAAAGGGLVCTYDGAEDSKTKRTVKQEELEREATWKNAIKVAAQQASRAVGTTTQKQQPSYKVAILSADEAVDTVSEETDDSSKKGGNLLGALFKGKVEIPETLAAAMCGEQESESSSNNLLTLRYGQLFGTPESSPDFSPLLGGPKKQPEFCQEYVMRSVRVDPTLSVSGNLMLSGSTTQSSRHAVGEAAALMALGKVPVTNKKLDVSLSSQRGTDPVDRDTWQEEFARVQEMLESGQGAQLFSTDFGKVPNVPRLADWLATKWAPTVLRTYDIAAIRVGARPVYVLQPAEDVVEIVWQQLVNFESVVVGKMIIQVTDNGLVALRGPGNAAQGFGEISMKPLAGEDVLVRRLAEAASQAIEKGLADKVSRNAGEEIIREENNWAIRCCVLILSLHLCSLWFIPFVWYPHQPKTKTAAAAPVEEAPVEAPAVVSSLQSSGTAVTPPAAKSAATGPRQAGVRRSTERTRGKRRKARQEKED